MLDHTHNEASRKSCKDCGEQNPPDHLTVAECLVAGKANGVAGVVGRIVHAVILCQTSTKHQK